MPPDGGSCQLAPESSTCGVTPCVMPRLLREWEAQASKGGAYPYLIRWPTNGRMRTEREIQATSRVMGLTPQRLCSG